MNKQLIDELCIACAKSVAVYELLHAHARGETDLTEDQLANVVTGVRDEAAETLERARLAGWGGVALPHGWVSSALRRGAHA